MNRIVASLCLILTLSSVAPALGSGAPAASGAVPPIVKAIDADGNGEITKEEWGDAKQHLLELNSDDKEELSSEELGVSPVLIAIDENGDRTIDKDELDGVASRFDDLDTDKNGTLNAEELGVGSGGSGDPADLLLCIIYACVALLFSSLCSVAEAVLLSVSPSYIANLENEGKPSAKSIKDVKTNVDRSLAAILTLNTIAHTIGSGGAGAYAAKYWGDNAVGIAMVVLTLLILFVSEIIPKTIGAVYWRSLAPITATFIKLLNIVLYPLIFRFGAKLRSGSQEAIATTRSAVMNSRRWQTSELRVAIWMRKNREF